MIGTLLKRRLDVLFDSDITAYQIEQDTGISRVTISRYRSEKNNIGNMTLSVAMRLEAYGDKMGLYMNDDLK